MILWFCEACTSRTDELLMVLWWDLVPWEAAVPGSCWVPSSKFNHWARKEKHNLTYNPWQIADPCIWEETIICVHTILFSVSSNSLSSALRKKVWVEDRKFSFISLCEKSLLEVIEFSCVRSECNNCLKMWSFKLNAAHSCKGILQAGRS